jgi:hypothetical protein
MKIGRQAGGLAAIALGAFVVLWGDFATPWQNVPLVAPLRGQLAHLLGAILIAAGAGMFWLRAAKPASLVLAAIGAGFAVLWALVAAHAPQIYDSWGNIAEQSSVAAGFLAILASLAPQKTDATARLALGARVWFGICSISFGVVHFVSLAVCARFVPAWMPFGGLFWAVFTGVMHLAVAVALLSGIWALLAARLAALMYLGFGILGWGTYLVGRPSDHFVWGGEIITLTLAAGVWMVGDSIAAFPPKDGALFLPRRRGRDG